MSRTALFSRQMALAVSLSAAMIYSPQVKGQDAEQEQENRKPVVDLTTVYLADPIGRAHRINIEGELGGAARITLEGNTCAVDQFGDTSICTEVYFPPIDVTTVQVRLADPTGQGRRLFLIQGDLQPPGSSYYLVVPRRRGEAHRLVVELNNDHRRVVSLEKVPAPTGTMELCASAEYRAAQSAGKVVIHASGNHNTSGWTTALERLPIEIHPPQYRLVCQAPDGPVLQVITPFEVQASFEAQEPVDHVFVHDARGRHRVEVR